MLPLFATFLLASPVWAGTAEMPPDISGHGANPEDATGGSGSVGETVKGIITYTRWPAKLQQLRFCFFGESAHESYILREVRSLAPDGAISFKRFEATRTTLFGCDVVYIAEPHTLDSEVAIGRFSDSKWILTIGEGEDFCSVGGMFCLTVGADETHFATNLDAIARSELKVNPLVLKLSRQLRRGQP